jgi:hypothetical protein
MTRPASPADLRNGLDPAAVDALAAQLHALRCAPLAGPDRRAHDPRHRDYDLSSSRFLLLGLRDTGWALTPTT